MRLDLTGDRPLKRSDAFKLARWWAGNNWSTTITKQGRYFRVIATRNR